MIIRVNNFFNILGIFNITPSILLVQKFYRKKEKKIERMKEIKFIFS